MSKQDVILQEWWEKINNDPMEALNEFMLELKDENSEAYEQGKAMQEGNKSSWQYGSRDLKEAVTFLITNTIMKTSGMGVIK